MNSRWSRLLGTLALISLLLQPGSGAACPQPRPVVSPPLTRVVEAHRLLRAGRYAEAVRLLIQEFPKLRRMGARQVHQGGLTSQALWLAAVATVRTGGRVAAGTDWKGTTALDQQRNLRWAETILRAMRKSTPAVDTLWAELLSQGTAAQKRRAYVLLQDLARRNRLRDPEAWAALARLHLAQGDAAAANRARTACLQAAGPAYRRLCATTLTKP